MPMVAITLPFSVPASTLAPCWAAARAGSLKFEILPERKDMNIPGIPNMGYMAMGSTSQETRVPDISCSVLPATIILKLGVIPNTMEITMAGRNARMIPSVLVIMPHL